MDSGTVKNESTSTTCTVLVLIILLCYSNLKAQILLVLQSGSSHSLMMFAPKNHKQIPLTGKNGMV